MKGGREIIKERRTERWRVGGRISEREKGEEGEQGTGLGGRSREERINHSIG